MLEVGFLRLPGVASSWVADGKFTALDLAKEAIAKAATRSGAAIHKSYLVEYGGFAIYPEAGARRRQQAH